MIWKHLWFFIFAYNSTEIIPPSLPMLSLAWRRTVSVFPVFHETFGRTARASLCQSNSTFESSAHGACPNTCASGMIVMILRLGWWSKIFSEKPKKKHMICSTAGIFIITCYSFQEFHAEFKSLPIIWIELETSARSKNHKLRYPILSHGFATTPMVASKIWNRLNRLETSTPDGIFLRTPGTPGTHATCLLLSPKSMMYKWCLGEWWIFPPPFFRTVFCWPKSMSNLPEGSIINPI